MGEGFVRPPIPGALAGSGGRSSGRPAPRHDSAEGARGHTRAIARAVRRGGVARTRPPGPPPAPAKSLEKLGAERGRASGGGLAPPQKKKRKSFPFGLVPPASCSAPAPRGPRDDGAGDLIPPGRPPVSPAGSGVQTCGVELQAPGRPAGRGGSPGPPTMRWRRRALATWAAAWALLRHARGWGSGPRSVVKEKFFFKTNHKSKG